MRSISISSTIIALHAPPAALVVAAGLTILAAILVAHAFLHHAIIQGRDVPPPPLARYPSMTVIRPVRGLDVGARENFKAALAADYPGDLETIFVFDDGRDAALSIAESVIAEHRASGHPGTARILIAGHPPAHRTGKMHAMIAGTRAAQGELIAFGDSDTRPTARALRALVEKLMSTPGAGDAFAPVVMAEKARTAGDAGCALMLNGLYSPGVAVGEGKSGDVPFIMGQLMLFPRTTLEAIGGLENIRGELVDDMHIGMRVAAAGLRNVMTTEPLPIIIEGTPFRKFAADYRRWLIFSRTGLPGWSFKWPQWMHGILFMAGLLVTTCALAGGHFTAALVPGAAMLAFGWSVVKLHRDVGGAPIALRHMWIPFAVVLAAPFVILSSILWPEVNWRGRTYSLTAGSRLSESNDRGLPGLIRSFRRWASSRESSARS